MKRIFIAPYKLGSSSAKKLADNLNILRVSGLKKFKYSDIIIKWGNLNVDIKGTNIILNNNGTSTARNKLKTLEVLTNSNIKTIDWTTNKNKVIEWLSLGEIVYGRQTLSSHSGEGIILISDSNTIPDCPLYTKGLLKAHEYRVHVFNNKVIDIQKKKRRNGEDSNDYIKNHSNGWVYCRDEVKAPLEVYSESLKAINALGLDFGAVDILYKGKTKQVAILEINTAPGLEGKTLEIYTKTLKEFVNAL